MITATLYTDPGCPWAYSENPALRVIEWRYGDQIDWKLVLIGLTERSEQYVARGYTPLRGALGQLRFRRYGMPFAPEPKPRVSATARACRAVVAARLQQPGSEWAVFRALQLANFTSSLVLEDDEGLRAVIATVPGVDADAIVAAARFRRGDRGLRGRQGLEPERRRLRDRAAGQGRQLRRPGALHGSVGDLRIRTGRVWRQVAFSRSRRTT